MNINTTRERGALIAQASGNIDHLTADSFQAALTDAVSDEDTTVIVNLSRVSYVSSAGLRAILKATKELRSRGATLALCAITDEVLGVFRISGFAKVIRLYDSQDHALTELAPSS